MDININCDLGEGTGNDAAIMPFISSCSIACGGHFGDDHTMRQTVRLAKQNGVGCGAHPSYPDRANFGRKPMAIPVAELSHSLNQQITDFHRICLEEGVVLHHIKLHGALYNQAAKDPQTALIVLDAIDKTSLKVPIYAPWKSALAKAAKGRYRILFEAFADRRYHADLRLVSRSHPDAVITDKEEVSRQVLSILKKGQLTTIEGRIVPIKADTFCVHGDQRNAVEILRFLDGIRGI